MLKHIGCIRLESSVRNPVRPCGYHVLNVHQWCTGCMMPIQLHSPGRDPDVNISLLHPESNRLWARGTVPAARALPALAASAWVFLSTFAGTCAAATHSTPDPVETNSVHKPASTDPDDGLQRLRQIHALGLQELSGAMPAYYSASARTRARDLQQLLGGETDYYAELMHVKFSPVILAVLSRGDWAKVVSEPYGLPSTSDAPPFVFVMPASWKGVTFMSLPRREETDPALVARVLVKGRTWERVTLDCVDGIGAHEIGHQIVRQLHISPQVHWLDEWLASYIGYAYMAAKDPERAWATVIFSTNGLKHSAHPVNGLEAFETQYARLTTQSPENYVWYEHAFEQRVFEIFEQQGVDLIRQLQVTFPADGSKLNTAQVLERLEALHPGWQAWAAQVAAGQSPLAHLNTRPSPERFK